MKSLLLLLLALESTALARERIQGFCEQGNTLMLTSGLRSTNKAQGSFPGCTVTVRLAGTVTSVAIYSDRIIPGTPKSNPFTADANGWWFFYVDDGRYDVQLSGGGLPAPWTMGDIQVREFGEGATSADVKYLWAHFQDDDAWTLRLSYSSDAVHWKDIGGSSGSMNAGHDIRDISVIYQNGTYYFLASPAAVAVPQPLVQLWSSTDLISFSAIQTIDIATYIPGSTACWGPRWWVEPNGNSYFWCGWTDQANPFGLTAPMSPILVQLNPATGAVIGSPQHITLNGTTINKSYDYRPWFYNGVYYILYVDQTGIGDGSNDIVDQPIVYATSNALAGPYTQQVNGDHFGFMVGYAYDNHPPGYSYTEAPMITDIGNGCVQITADTWVLQDVGAGTAGRDYWQVYKTSCLSAGALFSAASLTPAQGSPPNRQIISASENGGTVNVTSAMRPVVDHAIAFMKADNNVNGHFGVNTEHPFYTLSVRTRGANPGFIQYNEAVGIGWDTGNGSYAALNACGANLAGCALPQAAPGALNMNYSDTGGFGMFQLSNKSSVAATGEASMLFANGLNAFGRRPVTSSPLSEKALWTAGTNSLMWSKIVGTREDNWFGVHNGGVGGQRLVASVAPDVLISPPPASGCYGMRISVATNVTVTDIGRQKLTGNIGNHPIYVMNSGGTVIGTGVILDVGPPLINLSTSNEYAITGQFTYVPVSAIATPTLPGIPLVAGQTYYILAGEFAGGDGYTTATITPDAAAAGVMSITGQALRDGPCVGVPSVANGANRTANPLDLIFAEPPITYIGGYPLGISPNTGEVRVNWGMTLGSGTGTAYAQDVYANIDAFGSLGSEKRINFGDGTLGNADALLVAKSMTLGAGGYLARRGGVNTDLAGFLTLNGAGLATRVFTNAAEMAGAICTCSVASSLAACQAFINPAGTINFAGPVGGNINYICVGDKF